MIFKVYNPQCRSKCLLESQWNEQGRRKCWNKFKLEGGCSTTRRQTMSLIGRFMWDLWMRRRFDDWIKQQRVQWRACKTCKIWVQKKRRRTRWWLVTVMTDGITSSVLDLLFLYLEPGFVKGLNLLFTSILYLLMSKTYCCIANYMQPYRQLHFIAARGESFNPRGESFNSRIKWPGVISA